MVLVVLVQCQCPFDWTGYNRKDFKKHYDLHEPCHIIFRQKVNDLHLFFSLEILGHIVQ